jgi:YD repeat-containing protein
VTDALGDMTVSTYDGVGNVISVTDANGHTTKYNYDQLNRRSTVTEAVGTPQQRITQYFYDAGTFSGSVRGITCDQCGSTPGSSLITEQIDPDGSAGLHAGVTFYKYDALDRPTIQVRKVNSLGVGCPDTIVGTSCPEIVDSNDAVTSYTYDPFGNRLSLTEPDCNTTTYVYDPDNRLITETNAAGDVTSTAYDPVSNVTTVTAPNGNVTTNAYDSLNRLTQVTDTIAPPCTPVTKCLVASYTYDPVGNRTSQGDGNGNITSYAYDPLNRLMTETDPLSKATQYFYDFVGNLTQVLDRSTPPNPTIYAYDFINRRISMTDALGNITRYEYDAVGNLTHLTDANLHTTDYFYDAVNRPMEERYADDLDGQPRSRFFAYDPVGNLATRKDQKLQTTDYIYNDLYFLISRTYPSAINDTFTYDLSGRMLSAQRGPWLDTFDYDGANRILLTVQNGRTITYSYDIPGRTRSLTYPGGRVITDHTDARTRIDHIDDVGSPPPIVQYAYDLANNVLSRNYRNGTTSSFTYNANNWTTSIAHNNLATFAGFNYAYDNEGNRQFEQKTHDPSHSECYVPYDNTYRLINYKVGPLVGSCVPAPVTQTSYNLDPVGNWSSKTTDGVTQERTHNATNELIKIDATNLMYDANGNLTNDGKYTYTYDEENRIATETRVFDGSVCQYQYDALSRRVQKVPLLTGACTATSYFYDDSRVIEDENGLGVTLATYVYGNYVDEVLTMNRGKDVYYYHQNSLWSVEVITDQTAAPVEQ